MKNKKKLSRIKLFEEIVSFMENNPDFHGKAPTAAEVETALKELE